MKGAGHVDPDPFRRPDNVTSHREAGSIRIAAHNRFINGGVLGEIGFDQTVDRVCFPRIMD